MPQPVGQLMLPGATQNVGLATQRNPALVVGIRPSAARPGQRERSRGYVLRSRDGPLQPRWMPIGPGLGSRLVLCKAHSAIPPSQGLFDPQNDKDACGVGFVGELSKQPSRKCIKDALMMLQRMTHRGACGCEANTGKTARHNFRYGTGRSIAPPWRPKSLSIHSCL